MKSAIYIGFFFLIFSTIDFTTDRPVNPLTNLKIQLISIKNLIRLTESSHEYVIMISLIKLSGEMIKITILDQLQDKLSLKISLLDPYCEFSIIQFKDKENFLTSSNLLRSGLKLLKENSLKSIKALNQAADSINQNKSSVTKKYHKLIFKEKITSKPLDSLEIESEREKLFGNTKFYINLILDLKEGDFGKDSKIKAFMIESSEIKDLKNKPPKIELKTDKELKILSDIFLKYKLINGNPQEERNRREKRMQILKWIIFILIIFIFMICAIIGGVYSFKKLLLKKDMNYTTYKEDHDEQGILIKDGNDVDNMIGN